MVPSSIEFVDSLPQTESGKVLRVAGSAAAGDQAR
jgi:acyl-coenzyme A synthetase/AMP-(fatty) acid ligase